MDLAQWLTGRRIFI